LAFERALALIARRAWRFKLLALVKEVVFERVLPYVRFVIEGLSPWWFSLSSKIENQPPELQHSGGFSLGKWIVVPRVVFHFPFVFAQQSVVAQKANVKYLGENRVI
jgi:hypothetical protein